MCLNDKTPAVAVVILADYTATQAPCARVILAPLYGNAEEAVLNE